MRVLVICVEGFYGGLEAQALNEKIITCFGPAFADGDIDDVLIFIEQSQSKYYIIDTKEGLKQCPEQTNEAEPIKYTPSPFMTPPHL